MAFHFSSLSSCYHTFSLLCRMAQQYYEYANYKEEHVQEQRKLPKGACHSYVIVFQSVFFFIFSVSFFLPPHSTSDTKLTLKKKKKSADLFVICFLPHQLSFVFAEFPMRLVLHDHLHENLHILFNVKTCGKHTSFPLFTTAQYHVIL